MWFFRSARASVLPVWIAGAAVFALKIAYLLSSSIRGLASTTWLLDDSLIEMCVSRNIAQGFGFSLDRIHATTGAPFAWIYLAALNHFLPTKDAAIYATFIESAFFGILATIVVFFLALKLTQDRRIAWTAFLLATFTGNAFFTAMNGMDTAMFTFFVLLAIAMFLGVGRPARWSSFVWGCCTGLMLGLAMMTRGDGIFILAGLFGCAVYEWWRSPRAERRDHVRRLFGILLLSGVCFAIFMTWQMSQTGSPFPGNQVGRRGLALALHGFSFDDFQWLPYLKIVLWNVFQLENLLTIAMGSGLLAVVAFIYGSCHRKLWNLSVITGVYLGIYFALLVAYQWYFADFHGLRYINPGVHILFIYVSFLLWQIPVEFGRKLAVFGACACILILALYRHYQIGTKLVLAPYYSYLSRPDPEKSKILWGTMDWMKANLPPGTAVGIRDYGRACLFTDLPVQDIAGNIDPAAAAALNDGTLGAFLKERNVNYLLIPDLETRKDKLYQYLHGNLTLRLVPGAPKSPTQNLYRIVW